MAERPVRKLTEPQVLRAMAHPTRLAIIDILSVEGAATATRCAELTDESVASCSYHLGMLAKYGFVAPAEAEGREKPWRLTDRSHSWENADHDDVESQLAAETLSDVHVDHNAAQIKRATRRLMQESPEWRHVTGSSAGQLYLTAEESKALSEELTVIARRYVERIEDPSLRPPGARPVSVYFATWLSRPPDKEV